MQISMHCIKIKSKIHEKLRRVADTGLLNAWYKQKC